MADDVFKRDPDPEATAAALLERLEAMRARREREARERLVRSRGAPEEDRLPYTDPD